MSEDRIGISGVVATDPRFIETGEGLAIVSFRLASNARRYDRRSQSWVDGDTNWYTVTAFRQLAVNVSRSLVKGERAIVQGRLKVREWSDGERSGVQVEIEASAIGHDLTWGTTSLVRSVASGSQAAGFAACEPSPSGWPGSGASVTRDSEGSDFSETDADSVGADVASR